MIKSFKCSDFRNVTCNEMDFAKINILIGPNNSGKSNFIRALSFAANMVNAHSDNNTGFMTELKRNGWETVIDRNSRGKEFELVWKFEIEKNYPVTYTLKAHTGTSRSENYITNECLDNTETRADCTKPYNYFRCHSFKQGIGEFSTAGMESGINKRVQAKVDSSETVLLQMNNLFFENPSLFSQVFVRDKIRQVLDLMRQYFRGFYSYSCTSFNIAEIRELQDVQNVSDYLKKDGSNFVNIFKNIEDKDESFKIRFMESLALLMPGFEDIRVQSAAGKMWIELKINGFYFPLSEVSDGTVHLLLLLLMLNLPESYGISLLAIDEPEMNLHPAWQKMLAHEILNGQSFKQCFISTHSADFLDEFTEGFLAGEVNIFVFDPSRRKSIRKLDKEDLIQELDGWTLGDLYRVGDPIIGGWPQ